MIGSKMLVTSCPECEATFRISTGILEKADGQVRCGHCATIFDANSDLRELEESESASELIPEPQSALESVPSEADAEAQPETEEADGEKAGPVPDDPEWLSPVEAADRRTRPWAVGAFFLAVILPGQMVHQFRAELASLPTVGRAVTAAYSTMGIEISPLVDLDQYELLDLTAVAIPASEENGSLIIETRVQNKGPRVQPYPHIFVRLLGRWEDTIAGRIFGQEEYAVGTISNLSRMNVGDMIDAQFIIVDPGPSATGFEVELCVRVDGGFQCESDVAYE